MPAETRVITIRPPQALIEPCQMPSADGMETNRDLVLFTSSLIAAFEECAAKIDAIRGYYDGDQ